MFYNGKNIGGAEHRPALTRFNGDPGECQKYIYEARLLLGDLKQQMQGHVKWGQMDQTLDNGVKLHAQSNQYGLADIDEIWIDVTESSAVTGNGGAGNDECIGFIAHINSTAFAYVQSSKEYQALQNGEDSKFLYLLGDQGENGAIALQVGDGEIELTKERWDQQTPHQDEFGNPVVFNPNVGFDVSYSPNAGFGVDVFYGESTSSSTPYVVTAWALTPEELPVINNPPTLPSLFPYYSQASTQRNNNENIAISAKPKKAELTKITTEKSTTDSFVAVLPGSVEYDFKDDSWRSAATYSATYTLLVDVTFGTILDGYNIVVPEAPTDRMTVAHIATTSTIVDFGLHNFTTKAKAPKGDYFVRAPNAGDYNLEVTLFSPKSSRKITYHSSDFISKKLIVTIGNKLNDAARLANN